MLPWIVYCQSPSDFYRIVTRFGTRAEAEMHAQYLNKFVRNIRYKVCFEQPTSLLA